MDRTFVAKVLELPALGSQSGFTTTSAGDGPVRPEFNSLRSHSAGIVNEFGSRAGSFTAYGQRVGNVVIARPLTMTTYWNQEGYVAISNEFENVIGFGLTSREACNEALSHLIHLREDYGDLTSEYGTDEALDLRDMLNLYLVSVGN